MNTSIDQMHFLVLHIGKTLQHGNWNYKHICSPFTRIYYILSGHAQIEFGNGFIQDLKPGHMYIIPAFITHSYICHSDFCHYYIHIYNEADNNVLEDWELPTEIRAAEGDLHLIERLYELCPDMSLQQTDPQFYDNRPTLVQRIIKNKQRELYAKIESRGIIYQLLSRFLQTALPKTYIHDLRVAKVLEYVRTHISTNIDIELLADLSCLSRDHLIRLFKKEMKITPLHYINQKKIEKAQLKLITETIPVKEIAYQLGYEDHSYFNRLFKKITGLTPKAYRNSYLHPAMS